MTENKRFTLEEFGDRCVTHDNGSPMNTRQVVEFLNAYEDENKQLKSENESYKNMFFEIVETALTDTNCKELYCKGILDIFDKANSLNQAREMIKEHLK